jgi:hypothetical protein
VLPSAELLALLESDVVPLVLAIDAVNTEDLTERAGRPTLEGEALEDNDRRLALKNALYAASPRDPRQPPFFGVLDADGEVLAADTGLLTGAEPLSPRRSMAPSRRSTSTCPIRGSRRRPRRFLGGPGRARSQERSWHQPRSGGPRARAG